jgi:hypothetical protein
MNNNNIFLPIGTICRLKNGNKYVMVTGFCPVTGEENKMYDYSGCIYPEGMISSDINLVFNNSQIEEIIFKGFENEEELVFKKQLENFVATGNVTSNANISIKNNKIETPELQNQQPVQQTTNVLNNSVGLFNTLPNMNDVSNE